MSDQSLNSLLKNLSPRLNEGEFVFCCVDDDSKIGIAEIEGLFRELEGTTVVLKNLAADRNGLDYETVLSWITLDVNSSLEAVGLTAQVSSVLANENIACNVVAGFHHDHLFVPVDDAERAMEVLNKLVTGTKG